MKKIILAVIITMIAISAQAREMDEGTLKLSGATNASLFNSTIDIDGSEFSDTTTFSLEGDAVYFFTKNIGVGASISYERAKTDYPAALGGGWDKATMIIIGPTVAADLPLSDSLDLIADASIGYFQMTQENDRSKDYDADGLAWKVSAGVAIFPVEYVSLDLTADYLALDGDDTVTDLSEEISSFGLNLGLSIYLD